MHLQTLISNARFECKRAVYVEEVHIHGSERTGNFGLHCLARLLVCPTFPDLQVLRTMLRESTARTALLLSDVADLPNFNTAAHHHLIACHRYYYSALI